MKKILLILCLFISLSGCASIKEENKYVDSRLMNILEIGDETLLEDASEIVNLEVSNDKATLNIYDVIAYEHFLLLFGSFKDKKGNPLTISSYDFNINGNSKTKLGGNDRSFIKYYDDYFILYFYSNQYEFGYSDHSDLMNITFNSDGISLSLDITLDKPGESTIKEYDEASWVDVSPLFIHIQGNNPKFGTDSITLYDINDNVLDYKGTSLKHEGESGWYTYIFDKYEDVSIIKSIEVNTQYYEIDSTTGRKKVSN